MSNKVSILIPVYNRASLLPKAIDSCFNQSHKNIEIIIYDDGSTDNIKSIIQSYQSNKIKFISNRQNLGIGHSRNMLLNSMTGDYGMWLDSDDFMPSDRIAKNLSSISSYDIMYSNILRFTQHENFINFGNPINIDISKYSKNSFNTLKNNTACATAFFRKEISRFEFSTDLKHGGEDTLWLWKLINADIKIGHIPEPLYYYRSHADRIGIIKKLIDKDVKDTENKIMHKLIDEISN